MKQISLGIICSCTNFGSDKQLAIVYWKCEYTESTRAWNLRWDLSTVSVVWFCRLALQPALSSITLQTRSRDLNKCLIYFWYVKNIACAVQCLFWICRMRTASVSACDQWATARVQDEVLTLRRHVCAVGVWCFLCFNCGGCGLRVQVLDAGRPLQGWRMRRLV